MMKIITLDKTTSTNDEVKKYVEDGQSVAVSATVQTGGRGTKGRTFISQEGGLYVSFLKFYNNLLAKDAHKIVEQTAVAVVKTLRAFGVDARIKWVNDIYVNGKKICGILTENVFEGEFVKYSVIGIGININNEISGDIKDIAISTKQVLGKSLDIKAVLMTLVFNLEQKQEDGPYVRYSCVLGKKIKVVKPNGEEYFAKAKDILPDGRLLLDNGEKLSAAEIKINIL